jgi:hypothetical protein
MSKTYEQRIRRVERILLRLLKERREQRREPTSGYTLDNLD